MVTGTGGGTTDLDFCDFGMEIIGAWPMSPPATTQLHLVNDRTLPAFMMGTTIRMHGTAMLTHQTAWYVSSLHAGWG